MLWVGLILLLILFNTCKNICLNVCTDGSFSLAQAPLTKEMHTKSIFVSISCFFPYRPIERFTKKWEPSPGSKLIWLHLIHSSFLEYDFSSVIAQKIAFHTSFVFMIPFKGFLCCSQQNWRPGFRSLRTNQARSVKTSSGDGGPDAFLCVER